MSLTLYLLRTVLHSGLAHTLRASTVRGRRRLVPNRLARSVRVSCVTGQPPGSVAHPATPSDRRSNTVCGRDPEVVVWKRQLWVLRRPSELGRSPMYIGIGTLILIILIILLVT